MGASIYPPTKNDGYSKGVVTYQAVSTTAYLTSAETIVYTQSFTAVAGRLYRVTLRGTAVDTDSTGDNSSLRYAKQGAQTSCRWAAGDTVTTASTAAGFSTTTTFDDDSITAIGMNMIFYLPSLPAGLVTIGIGLAATRSSTTYGMVRFLPGTGGALVIEDVGLAV
jgi:hypothetical protein